MSRRVDIPNARTTFLPHQPTARAAGVVFCYTVRILPYPHAHLRHRTPRSLRTLLSSVAAIALIVPSGALSSTWNPALLVNTEAFQVIDDSDTASNVALRFGDTVNEEIRWDRGAGRFNITDDLSVQGNLSGTTLRVDRNADVWGSLGVSGSTVLNRVSYLWPGTPAAASGKVLKVNPATGQLSWSADQTGGGGLPAGADTHVQFNDGGLAFGADSDFTWDQTGNRLTVRGNMSGYTLRVSGNADVWGALSATGTIRTQSGAVVNADNDTNNAVLVFGNQAAPQALRFLHSRQIFQFSKNTDVLGTASGSQVHATQQLRSSGSLAVAGAVTLKSFANCTALETANGVLGCGTDDVGGGAAGISDHYVRASGDTMTGGLLIESRASGTPPATISAGLLLEVAGTASGNNLFATKSLTGSHLNATTTFGGAGLSNCTGTSNKLTWLSASKQFACETDQTGGGAATESGYHIKIVGGLDASAAATNLAANTLNCVSDTSLRMLVNWGKINWFKWSGRFGGAVDSTGTGCGDRTCMRLQYHSSSTNLTVATGDAGWTTLDSSAGGHTVNAWFTSNLIAVPAGAKRNPVQIRGCVYGGDGTADPTITGLNMMVYP